jgi:hypothetical protein
MEVPVIALTPPPPAGVPVVVHSVGSSNGSVAGTRRDIGCAECGFGAVVVRPPDRCPMCGGTSWRERATPPRRGK